MPAAARKTDTINTMHNCDAITYPSTCSTNVFINGIGAVLVNNLTEPHNYEVLVEVQVEDTPPDPLPPDYKPTYHTELEATCVPHQTRLLETGNTTVTVNGLTVACAGDVYDGGEIIATGSSNVSIGL